MPDFAVEEVGDEGLAVLPEPGHVLADVEVGVRPLNEIYRS